MLIRVYFVNQINSDLITFSTLCSEKFIFDFVCASVKSVKMEFLSIKEYSERSEGKSQATATSVSSECSVDEKMNNQSHEFINSPITKRDGFVKKIRKIPDFENDEFIYLSHVPLRKNLHLVPFYERPDIFQFPSQEIKSKQNNRIRRCISEARHKDKLYESKHSKNVILPSQDTENSFSSELSVDEKMNNCIEGSSTDLKEGDIPISLHFVPRNSSLTSAAPPSNLLICLAGEGELEKKQEVEPVEVVDIKLKNDVPILTFVKSLPEDIQKYIYKEFFETNMRYHFVYDTVIPKCSSLTNESIYNLSYYIKLIINDINLKKYFMNNSTHFKMIFTKKSKGEKMFSLITDYYHDFALSWAMSVYH